MQSIARHPASHPTAAPGVRHSTSGAQPPRRRLTVKPETTAEVHA
ncbi:hypothetical protein ACIQPR_09810 [Streptomyces sp. NPDC091280]